MDLLREKYGSVRVASVNIRMDGLMEEMNFAAIAFVGSVHVTNCYFEPEVRFSGLGRRNLAASHTFRESRFSRVESNGSERICPSPYQACLLTWEDARILFRYMPAFKRRNWGRFVGAVQEPPSGTSMRIIPSCLEVRNNSPSRLWLMCRSHRTTVLPIFFSIRSRNDTSTRLPLASRT